MKNPLFICFTPLHILIAKQIILTEDIHKAKVLAIELSYNKKLRFYLNKEAKYFHNQIRIFSPEGKTKIFKLINLLKFFLSNYSFLNSKTILLASLHDKYAQIIIRLINPKHIITFDDGIANLYPESLFLNDKFIKHNFIDKAMYHYTIFPNINNIQPKEKLKFIEFPSHKNIDIEKISSPKQTVRFFIGQPYNEMSNCVSESYIIRVLKELKIDYYLIHPRENYSKEIDKVCEIIDTNYIVEDYIATYLINNPNLLIELYSLNSTSLITTMHLDRLQASSISNKCLIKTYKGLYQIFKNLNISIMEIE